MKNSTRIALAASVLWIAILKLGGDDYFELHELEWDGLRSTYWFGLIVIWVLKFLLGTFVDKKDEDDPTVKVTLAQVIHWCIYGVIIGIWGWVIIELDAGNIYGALLLAAICIVPPAIFTIIYWIVTKRWAFFPWQHVKNERRWSTSRRSCS